MNKVTQPPKKSEEESIHKVWHENLNLLEGKDGANNLHIHDEKVLMSRLVKAFLDVEDLPEDLDSPETEDEVMAVNRYADALYSLFCEGADIAERMFVGDQVERAYRNKQEELGNTMSDHDKMVEAGHTEADFN